MLLQAVDSQANAQAPIDAVMPQVARPSVAQSVIRHHQIKPSHHAVKAASTSGLQAFLTVKASEML
jgi:hypothetical protein